MSSGRTRKREEGKYGECALFFEQHTKQQYMIKGIILEIAVLIIGIPSFMPVFLCINQILFFMSCLIYLSVWNDSLGERKKGYGLEMDLIPFPCVDCYMFLFLSRNISKQVNKMTCFNSLISYSATHSDFVISKQT